MCALYTAIIHYRGDEVVVDIAGGFSGILWVLKQLIHDATWESFEITRRDEKEVEKA